MEIVLQKFGLACSPATEPRSGNKDDAFPGSCSVSLFVSVLLLLGWEFLFLWVFFLFLNENKSHWHGLHKHSLNQKALPLD